MRRPGVNTLLDALGERDDRDAAVAKAAQRPEPGGELAGTAVDHDEAGQRCEARVVVGVVRRFRSLAFPLGEPTRQDSPIALKSSGSALVLSVADG